MPWLMLCCRAPLGRAPALQAVWRGGAGSERQTGGCNGAGWVHMPCKPREQRPKPLH